MKTIGCKGCILFNDFMFFCIYWDKFWHNNMQEIKNMRELVSVVVPIYNVEKYICDCIESIINQTYIDLEIILSNDGSLDKCGEICEEYAAKDSRIKVMHFENRGLSEARNRGIRIATGKYITFVDSDDILDHNFIQTLVEVIKEYSADIVVAGYRTFTERIQIKDASTFNGKKGDVEVLSEKHLYDSQFLKQETTCLTVAWGKLYIKTLFDNILYPISKLHEDTFTTYKLMYKAKKVVYLKKKLYFWRENLDSITRGTFRIEHFHQLDAYAEQLEFFYKKGEQRYLEIVFAEYIEAFFWNYNHMKELQMDLSLLKPYSSYIKMHLRYIKLTRSLGLRQWMRYRYLAWYKISKLIESEKREIL